METLKRKYHRLLKLTSTKHIREIYHRISWDTRLVGIKGARGVGFYPFYATETETDYLIWVNNMITSVIDYDIPAVGNVEYATLLKAKHLLTIIANQTPSPLNAKLTSEMLRVTPNQLVKILSLLERSQILRPLYFNGERNPKSMAKPKR